MGKKGRKTRWRRLPISGPDAVTSASASDRAENEHSTNQPPSPAHRVTFNEDEYTKITTPRQDVLFKKGYLGRRRNPNPTEVPEANSTDSVESNEYLPEEQQQYAFAPPTGFIDQNGVFYVNGGSYEVYDPYSGSLTVVVGPAAPPQYPPQPLLAAMPCQPVPLAPVEWFNPPAPWMCPYNNNNSRKKRYSTDSQNCSAQSSESTGPPGSPQEPTDMMECAGSAPFFPPQPPPYMYPGYMFGAPIYPMNGVNVQGVMPQSPVPTPDLTAKRRKKRRKKRRGGATDEGSESSCEEVIGCDNGVCSQSGASSDAGGQGSSCSKTNSDSGINTEPTPDSGSNTPPPAHPTNSCEQEEGEKEGEEEEDDPRLHLHHQLHHLHHHSLPCESLSDEVPLTSSVAASEEDVAEQEKTSWDVVEAASSCASTPEAHKRTFESLPSDDGETLQELSCSSEPPTDARLASCISESLPSNSIDNNSDHMIQSDKQTNEQTETVLDSSTETQSRGSVDICLPKYKSESITQITGPLEQPSDTLQQSCDRDTYSKEIRTDLDLNDDLVYIGDDSTSVQVPSVEISCKENRIGDESVLEQVIEREETACIQVQVEDCTAVKGEQVEKESTSNNSISSQDNVISMKAMKENELESSTICELLTSTLKREKVVSEEELKQIESEFDSCLSRFLKIQERVPPKPPPRRKRTLNRAAEKVATKLIDAALNDGVSEAAKKSCSHQQHSLPITEAVTRWLHSQGSAAVLSSSVEESDEDDGGGGGGDVETDVDEGIEEGESLTNQKNVEGNPFLVPYLSGSRIRVASDCAHDCVSVVSSAGEWDMYEHTHTRAILDPAVSVEKYYRLGADDPDDAKMAATASPSMIKTAMHIRRAGPFPCGVCCIIQ